MYNIFYRKVKFYWRILRQKKMTTKIKMTIKNVNVFSTFRQSLNGYSNKFSSSNFIVHKEYWV